MLIFIIFTKLLLFLHPIHLSITNISHIEEKNQLEFSIRLFRDDLEMIINHKYDQQISLTDDTVTTEEKTFVNKYINDMLIFLVNNDTLSIKKSRVEIENLMLVVNSSINFVGELSTLEIKNTLMMDAFKDQKNLLIINHKNKEKGYKFTIDDYQKIIEL